MNDNTYNGLYDAVSEIGQSRTVRTGNEWILVFRTFTQEPDVIQDVKDVLASLDIEDIRYIDSLLLIGSKKSVKVDSSLVEDLVGDRTRSPVIISSMKDEIDRDFGFKVYDRGPHRRLAARIPIIEIKDFKDEFTDKIKDNIPDDGSITPDTLDDILSVYLIADETYVRIDPGTFFQEIFDLMPNVTAKTDGSGRLTPPDRIILGESPRELVELALSRLKQHDIYRDVQFVEAAGLPYSFDALAVQEDDGVLLKYMDAPSDDNVLPMKLFMEALDVRQGWILTRIPDDDGQPLNKWEKDNISVLTINDL
ncbi:MAG: hypothetical protein HF976_14560 [ANME-2 cluster archaeon]|nr:hypothetical protein [ANME-2 cluster archaeon]MBC2702596.1 hypothetical protein [ANME-2 cluster archaeon]MBC2708140.1 hypothetical protein [ANME-2 cluster archaeon]MBC2745556.1 hypothetical protein [ANME-2 cluster archaeon]